MSDSNLTEQQQFVFDYVDRNARAIALLSDNIFYFGELGMQEFETAKLMTGLLEKRGFKVERGISGFPTGFCATYGSGHPVVAIAYRIRRQSRTIRRPPASPSRNSSSRARPAIARATTSTARCWSPRALAAKTRDGEVRPQGHAQGVRRAGRGAARQPALSSCATAGSTTSTSRSTTISAPSSTSATA